MARRRSRQEWRQIVLEWQQSGLRRAQFAHRHGLNPTTLGFWCWTLKTELEAAPPRLQLLPVQTVPIAESAEATADAQRAIVDLTGGALRVEFSLGADPRGIADLVAALRERGC